MATTQKGIYYNDDYTAAADVLEDERLMAESIDEALGSIEEDISEELEDKVDKDGDKVLSDNNFTDEDKEQIQTNKTDIAGIKNGTSINNFSQVESALGGKQDTLTFDNTPTANSINPVTSGGIKTYVDTIVGDIASALDAINGEII